MWLSIALPIAIPDALLILIFGQDRIGAASQEHHAHEERDDRLDRHDELCWLLYRCSNCRYGASRSRSVAPGGVVQRGIEELKGRLYTAAAVIAGTWREQLFKWELRVGSFGFNGGEEVRW